MKELRVHLKVTQPVCMRKLQVTLIPNISVCLNIQPVSYEQQSEKLKNRKLQFSIIQNNDRIISLGFGDSECVSAA